MKKLILFTAILAVVYTLADFRQGFINVQSAHVARIERALGEWIMNNVEQRFIFLVVVQEKREGQSLPDLNKYFEDARAAKAFAQTQTRFFARHSWRKASIKAIPI